jgi:hypothetical protein
LYYKVEAIMDWTESVQQDLAVMRKLAEQGGRLTMPGGQYYIMWGALAGLGFLGTYLIGTEIIPMPGWTIAIVWLVVNLAGLGGNFMLASRDADNPDHLRVSNRIVASVWTVTGITLGIFFLAIFASTFLGTNANPLPFYVTGVISPFFIGAAFAMIGLLCGLGWMLVPAGCWFVTGVAMVMFGFSQILTPIYAIVFVALMVGTGLRMLALERAVRG